MQNKLFSVLSRNLIKCEILIYWQLEIVCALKLIEIGTVSAFVQGGFNLILGNNR